MKTFNEWMTTKYGTGGGTINWDEWILDSPPSVIKHHKTEYQAYCDNHVTATQQTPLSFNQFYLKLFGYASQQGPWDEVLDESKEYYKKSVCDKYKQIYQIYLNSGVMPTSLHDAELKWKAANAALQQGTYKIKFQSAVIMDDAVYNAWEKEMWPAPTPKKPIRMIN